MSFETAATTLIAAFIIVAVCILHHCAMSIIGEEEQEGDKKE